MGVRFDHASSILLCAEESTTILDFDDDDDNRELGFHGEAKERVKELIFEQRCDFYGDSVMGLELQSEESLRVMTERESEFLPRRDYSKRLMDGDLDISIRRYAIDWIGKVHAYYNFGPSSSFSSINYLDRFLSAYELPKGKAWMTQLLSVACLSLAAKMEETEVPLILDFQVGEAKFIFEAKTIQRMELLVLSTLKWRMQAVTPFSFIGYFLNKFNNGDFQLMPLVLRSLALISSSSRGISLLEYRPSEIAAAVALVSLRETQVVEIDEALTSCIYVEKERVMKCVEVIQEIALMKRSSLKDPSNPSSSSLPQSPIGVLDAASLSYGSDISTVGSQRYFQNCSPISI